MPQTPSIQRLDPNFESVTAADGLTWIDARALPMEGCGWPAEAARYHRLPPRAQAVVRDPVWSLASHTAGMAIRFMTDAEVIHVRWRLRHKELSMAHMPASGMSGVDLYGYHDGAWRWAGCGIPQAIETSAPMGGALLPGRREYLLYLPLYNGIESLAIGIRPDATIGPATWRSDGGSAHKPFVIYGTSIVQGGCTSRAGMGYPETLARLMDRPSINLGFSGNGPMDLEMADFLGEIEVAAYVIDCLPNMTPDSVGERTIPFLSRLRAARPHTPILIVENIAYQRAFLQPAGTAGHEAKNAVLRNRLDTLRRQGMSGFQLVEAEPLLGTDGLGTVDGTHPNDLGFHRMAHALAPILQSLIPRERTSG